MEVAGNDGPEWGSVNDGPQSMTSALKLCYALLPMNIYKKYPATMNYLLFIVLLNTLFSYVPNFSLLGEPISVADIVVGLIYVMRDFAQRESGHGVIVAMLLGCLISWMLAEQQAAFASVMAFMVGEFLDWSIYTFTKKPFSQRVLWSSLISSPADSVVNLYFLSQLNWIGLSVMILTKFVGALGLWGYWKFRGDGGLLLGGFSQVDSVAPQSDF